MSIGTQYKRSVGLIGIRISPENTFEYLLVKKRLTYEFVDFIMGRYHKDQIDKMLNKMTIDEKLDIMTLDFSKMWYRVYLELNVTDGHYMKKKSRFDTTFLIKDQGAYLLQKIGQSDSCGNDSLWEFPKGRKEPHETDIICAVREFKEETKFIKNSYSILPGITRTQSFSDNNVKYENVYHVALLTCRYSKPRISLANKTQIKEINDIRWMSADEIKLIDTRKMLFKTIQPLPAIVKDRLK
jgi:8-oxo-dGTP pyrophosphatase MutT (NUDIX family)